jgi:ABC-type multidrug transport system ATPase subunit
MESVLQINEIKKSYGAVQALKGVTITVPKGSVYGILGPNGSGKTTMLGILLDVLIADSGQYQWSNYESAQLARQHIGSLLETPNFYHYLSAKNNLEISANIKNRGYDDIDHVLKLVNLYERRDSKFSTFSLGMKQRLAIAAALLGKPDILVLDEPTNGLDPAGIAEIRELIIKLNREGITIIIASHMLDEVEKVCTHMAILKLGNLITEGAVMDVLNDEDSIEIDSADNKKLQLILSSYQGVKSMRTDRMINVILNNGFNTEDLNKFCYEQGIILNHIQRRKRTLESKFIEITQ